MVELTAAMRAVLAAADALAASGVAPSVRTIAARTGLSHGWVQIQISRLRQSGGWNYEAGKGGRPAKVKVLPSGVPDPLRARARRIAQLKEQARLRAVEEKLRTKFAASLEEWRAITAHLIHGPDHGRPPGKR